MTERPIRNMGPKTSEWLAEVGVHRLDDVRQLGVEAVLRLLFRAGRNPSLNMAYALGGALFDCDWRQLPDEERSRLIFEYDAARRWYRGLGP